MSGRFYYRYREGAVMKTGDHKAINMKSHNHRETGSVFILVLWSLFFLGALALAVATMISSSMSLSTHMATVTTARSLARGGVDFAIVELMRNVTNWEVQTDSEMVSDEELFKDNDKLHGGTFTVYYEHISLESGLVVTNYGLLDESSKNNINTLSLREIENALVDIASTEDININAKSLAEEIYNSRDVSSLDSYYHCTGEKGEFELLQELLLLKSFKNDVELFETLEPYLTVYPEGSYQATVVGKALAPGGKAKESSLLVEVKIDFVFNVSLKKIIYWHEY